MRKRKRRRDGADLSIRDHVRKLGFSATAEYQDWCALHGFSRSLDKDDDDRQAEWVASLSTGPAWQRFTDQPLCPRPAYSLHGRSDDEIIANVLAGQVVYGHNRDKKFSGLCAGVQRLRGPDFDRHLAAFRELVDALRVRRCDAHLYPRPMQGRSPHSTCTFGEALALVAMRRSQWMRPLSEWTISAENYQEVFRSLVNHLFVKHTVPNFLCNSWYHADPKSGAQELKVFFHLAQGHSIRTAGIALPYSRRMSHYFQQAPDRYSLTQALRWGQVRGLGGSAQLAGAIVATILGQHLAHPAFWQHVIQWFIKHSDLDTTDIGPIIDYVNNQRFGVGNPYRMVSLSNGDRERQRIAAAQPRLSMLGRTPAALLREVERWHQELQYLGDSDLTWEESGIDSFQWYSPDGTAWTINELLGNGALVDEGRELNHCVGSYVEACAERYTTIWSLRCGQAGETKRALTIQVDLHQRAIIEARGKANRYATPTETAILEAWAWDAGLSMNIEVL